MRVAKRAGRHAGTVLGFGLLICVSVTQAVAESRPQNILPPARKAERKAESKADAGPRAIAPAPASRVPPQTLPLSLADAVFIGLRKNTTIRSAYIDRISQIFDLKVAEDIFTP